MDEHKTMSFAVLGVVSVLAVLSVVLLLTDSNKTGYDIYAAAPAPKVYGGAIAGDPLPHLNKRLVNGLAGTNQAAVLDTQVPYRNVAGDPGNVPSLQTACGLDEVERLFSNVEDYNKYGSSGLCRKLNNDPDGRWCCQKVDLATGTVQG